MYSASSGTWFSSLHATHAQAAADAGGGVDHERPLLAGGVVRRGRSGWRRRGRVGEDGEQRASAAAPTRPPVTARPKPEERAAADGCGGDRGAEVLQRDERRRDRPGRRSTGAGSARGGVRRSGSTGAGAAGRDAMRAGARGAGASGSSVSGSSGVRVAGSRGSSDRVRSSFAGVFISVPLIRRGPRPAAWQSRHGLSSDEPAGWRWLRALKPSGPWQVRQGGSLSSGCSTTGGRFATRRVRVVAREARGHVVLARDDPAQPRRPADRLDVAADADLVGGDRDLDGRGRRRRWLSPRGRGARRGSSGSRCPAWVWLRGLRAPARGSRRRWTSSRRSARRPAHCFAFDVAMEGEVEVRATRPSPRRRTARPTGRRRRRGCATTARMPPRRVRGRTETQKRRRRGLGAHSVEGLSRPRRTV